MATRTVTPLPATVKPGVVTGQALTDLPAHAKENEYAIPAVNVHVCTLIADAFLRLLPYPSVVRSRCGWACALADEVGNRGRQAGMGRRRAIWRGEVACARVRRARRVRTSGPTPKL